MNTTPGTSLSTEPLSPRLSILSVTIPLVLLGASLVFGILNAA
jgi:hypothetical protein